MNTNFLLRWIMFPLLFCLWGMKILYAQTGQDCISAFPVTVTSQPVLTDYQFQNGQLEVWYKITPSTTEVYLHLFNSEFGDLPYIRDVEVYALNGSCTSIGNPVWESHGNAWQPDDFQYYEIGGLTPGTEYRVKVARKAVDPFGNNVINTDQHFKAGWAFLPYWNDDGFLICPPPVYECSFIDNGHFDTLFSNVTGIFDGEHWYPATAGHFTEDMVCFWDNAFGTPDLASGGTYYPFPLNQYSPPYYAQMWSRQWWGCQAFDSTSIIQRSEGIMQNIPNLEAGKDYLLRYEYRSYFQSPTNITSAADLDIFRVNLLNSSSGQIPTVASNNPNSCAQWYYPGMPANNQQLSEINDIPYDTIWKSNSICFEAQDNYDQIVFYPLQLRMDSNGYLQVNSIDFVPLAEAGQNLVICIEDTLGDLCDPIAGATYQWSPVTGLNDPTITRPTVQPPAASTWYFLTTTFINGTDTCIATDSVLVSPFFDAAYATATKDTLCEGETSLLQAFLGDSVYWEASPSDPSLIGNENNPVVTVSPTVPTQYIAHIFMDSCEVTDTLYIVPAPPIMQPEIIGSSTMCCDQSCYTVNGTYASYAWGIDPTVPLLDLGDSACVAWSFVTDSVAYISLVVTDSYGCSATDTFTVTDDCCVMQDNLPPIGGSPIVIGQCQQSTLLSSVTAQTSISTANYILIYNELVIDYDVSFINCPRIYLGQDARITIQPGVSVEFRNDSLRGGCDYMWDRIYVTDSTAKITTRGSYFADAQVTIELNDGADHQISTSTFENNGKCIQINPYPGVLGDDEDIATNLFISSRGTLKQPYDQIPSNNTAVAIEATNVDSLIIDAENNFEGVDIGILTDNSSVSIQNQIMANITNPDPTIYGNDVGTGIWMKGVPFPFIFLHKYALVGGSNGDRNILDNVRWGIRSERNLNPEISFNQIDNVEIGGIIMRGNIFGEASISFNKVNSIDGIVGINTFNNRFTSQLIESNRINYTQANNAGRFRWGIFTANVLADMLQLDTVTMHLNQIKNSDIGIQTTLVANLNLVDNRIKIERTNSDIVSGGLNLMGINVQTCNLAQITDNRITRGVDAPDTTVLHNLTGIYIQNASGVLLQENIIQKMGGGIRAFGSTPTNDYYCNELKQCFHGFEFDAGVDISNGSPTPSYTDNRWIGNIGYNRMDGTVNTSAPRIWYYRNSGGTFDPLPNPFDAPQYIEFFGLSGNQPSNCSQGGGNGNGNGNGVGNGNSPNPGLREKLFGTIVRDEKAFAGNPHAHKFYDESFTYESLKSNATWLNLNPQSDQDYVQFKQNQDANNRGAFADVLAELNAGNINTASLLNDAIVCSCPQEVNQQIVNRIYLATIGSGNDSYTQQQKADLEAVACQDALLGGSAVYSARVMLGYDGACGGNLRYQSSEVDHTAQKLNELSLIPNPATTEVLIITDKIIENGTVAIYDLSGREIVSQSMNGTQLRIYIADIPNGTYLVQVHDGSRIVNTDKLIINN